TTAIVDLGYRGVDAEIAPIELIHRGKSKRLTDKQRRWLKRRQAVEPAIGHVKQDHGMQRCWLKGSEGDALHAVLCAAGYNLRWLLRAIARKGLKALFAPVLWLAVLAAWFVSELGQARDHAVMASN
ncbi:MAG: transposase, partial [Aquabacterium sp.]|uniref:transposase n=1 Tax=Aquabacterium sp. TaxID=1872578 RepID=UPI002721589B